MVRRCLSEADVVHKVFAILDEYSTLDVGCRFLNRISSAVLQKLVNINDEKNDGYYLCKQLYHWLSGNLGVANPPAACGNKAAALDTLRALIDSAQVRVNDTGEPRRLSDNVITYYKSYLKGKDYRLRKDEFDDSIVWQLPIRAAGFVVYNLNDLIKTKRQTYNDEFGMDQIGTEDAIRRIMEIGRQWYLLHSEPRLQIGDISRPGGIDTPDHQGHESGKIFDIRPLRNDFLVGDNASLTFNSPSYHLDYTKEFIRLVLRLYPGAAFHFNDPNIYNSPEFRGIVTSDSERVRKSKNPVHSNHVHIELS